jgi:hypothetical protein
MTTFRKLLFGERNYIGGNLEIDIRRHYNYFLSLYAVYKTVEPSLLCTVIQYMVLDVGGSLDEAKQQEISMRFRTWNRADSTSQDLISSI